MIDRNFGTFRGLVRLGLAYGQVAIGAAKIQKPEKSDVRRLVFVCHGNICRSAFADLYAKQLGINCASFGLSTSSNMPAHDFASQIAAEMGVPMESHLTTNLDDFKPQEGDLLLAMEVRHLWKIASVPKLASFPRTLLGLYANGPFPHLHDPYQLTPLYMPVCLSRVQSAVVRLKDEFPETTLS
jgi:protein-tyrosine phosphatase